MSKDSFMWQIWNLIILLVIVLRRWFYATPLAVTQGSPSHHILQLNAQQNLNSNHATTCSIPVNPFSATIKVTPSFVMPVIHPTLGHPAPIPLCWGGPPQNTLPAPAPKNAILIKAFADAISSKRNDQLRKWKLSQYNGDPLQWHEWCGQFKSAIDSQSLTDDAQLTQLKTLVTGKTKTAIDEFAYCSAMYKATDVHKLPPNMRESWSLFTVKNPWKKTILLDYNDWFKEKAEAHDLMKDSASKEYRYHQPSNQRPLLQLYNKRVFKNRNRALFQHLSHVASYARRATGCGIVVCLRKRIPRSEPKLLLKQSSVSLVCMRKTCIGNAQAP